MFPTEPAFPWLLYVYQWMPFPRRVVIYLREKGISQDLVKLVRVSDPQDGNQVLDPTFPPRPKGSLPILAIPSSSDKEAGNETGSWTYIRQSTAIIQFLEELCNKNLYGFSSPNGALIGDDLISRIRIQEVLTIAEELTVAWNPVRMFGTGAGWIEFPAGSKESLRWIRRALMTIETWWQEEDRDMSLLRNGVYGHVTLADIVLYQFLDFSDGCYGVDITVGSGETVMDPYGREVVEIFPKLVEFYQTFKERESGKKYATEGDVASAQVLENMQTWAEGVL